MTQTATENPAIDPAPCTLTAAQQAEFDRYAADRELTKLGHAITFLNNHMPMFGVRSYAPDDTWKTGDDGPPLYMNDVPAAIRLPMEEALANAAKYAAGYFGFAGARCVPDNGQWET